MMMLKRLLTPASGLLLMLCLLLPSAQAATAIAGHVVTITGKATAASSANDIRTLVQDSPVYSGDTVVTHPNSWVRIKFTDESFIILRPNSRFEIADFANTGDPATERSIFKLAKGGFRTVTGLIGKRNRANVRYDTTVATIGIRGTEPEVRLCQGDCMDIDPPPPDGLYIHVHKNAVDVSNANGTQDINAGEFGFVPIDGGAPQDLDAGDADIITKNPTPPPNPDDC